MAIRLLNKTNSFTHCKLVKWKHGTYITLVMSLQSRFKKNDVTAKKIMTCSNLVRRSSRVITPCPEALCRVAPWGIRIIFLPSHIVCLVLYFWMYQITCRLCYVVSQKKKMCVTFRKLIVKNILKQFEM